MTKNVNESGRTMLELLGVLAIMGVIMYGAIAGISFGIETYQINAAYHQIDEISEGITELYSWRGWYYEDMTDELCKNDIADCDSSDAIKPYLGGAEIKVKGMKSETNGNCDECSFDKRDPHGAHEKCCPYFQIQYDKISYMACTKLLDDDRTKYKYVVCTANDDGKCKNNNSNKLKCTSL